MYRSPRSLNTIVQLGLLSGLFAGPVAAQEGSDPPMPPPPVRPLPAATDAEPVESPTAATEPVKTEGESVEAAEAVPLNDEPNPAATDGEPVEAAEATPVDDEPDPAATESEPAEAAESVAKKAESASAPSSAAAVVPVVVKSSADSISTTEIMKMLQKQQTQLNAQSQLLQQQGQLLTNLQDQYTQAKTDYDKEITGQAALIDEQRKTMRTMQAKIDELSAFDPNAMTEDEKAFRSRLETLEDSIQASTNASSTTFDAESFPGSIPIPGTAAAIRIGGFVKANYIQSFDTIGSTDRFIVGSIPTDPIEQGDPRAELSVSQSRLSIDLRDSTKVGTLRAFIEGDFAADGDTFRLRHAFGQLGDIIAGKTWSNFVDVEASPEDIDFEGLNGRINKRKTQFRWFPKFGQNWNLLASVEDPDPEINNGEAVSLIPDLIVSGRRQWFDIFHVKTSVVVRQIEGRWEADDSVKDDTSGWGLSFSGKVPIKKWDLRDNFLFQFNVGNGIGSYINDLSTLEEGDAVFDPNGNLKALPAFGGYIAFQKWWKATLRSTFVGSLVRIDNYSFQPGDAYRSTQRATGNLIWSPASRVDLGAEILYGRREDKDGGSGDAWQIQMSSQYRF